MLNGQPNTTATWKNDIARFGCHAETAKAIFVAGSFNARDPKATLMKGDSNGEWAVSLPPNQRHYEYELSVNGGGAVSADARLQRFVARAVPKTSSVR